MKKYATVEMQKSVKILISALTWFLRRTVPTSRKAKPACIAVTITAPIIRKKTSVLDFKASMASPRLPRATVPQRRPTMPKEKSKSAPNVQISPFSSLGNGLARRLRKERAPGPKPERLKWRRRLGRRPGGHVSASVDRFAVLGEIEPFAFHVRGDPESHQHLDDQQQHEGDDAAPQQGRDHAIDLGDHLARVAVDPADRILGAGDELGGEDAGQERAHDAADAVDAEGVERVVVLEHAL